MSGSLDVATAQTVALILVGVLILVAVAALFLIRKIIAKLFIFGLVVALGVAVYTQRSELSQCPKTCSCSFFGYQLHISDPTLSDACRGAVS